MTIKPKVVSLGSCVIERDGKGFLVMFADGFVRGYLSYVKAHKAIHRYFAKHTPADAIGVGQLVTYDGSIQSVTSHHGWTV